MPEIVRSPISNQSTNFSQNLMIGHLRKTAAQWIVAVGFIIIGLSTGCQTGHKVSDLPPETGNYFRVGDAVTVSFTLRSGESKDVMPDHTERVREDGTITLLYLGPITALGKTAGQLQKEIHDLYVPKYFMDLNVTVRGEAAFYYVDGEVRIPGQKEYPGEMTVVKAISVAGGFTDFAKKTKVRLTHGGHSEIVNVSQAIQDPRYDLPVYPGDKIFVKRRILW
jgi:polysaccharide export outer membrane protein